MPEPVLGSEPQHFGTYLDGAMGWHNSYRVIDLAESYGWELTADDAKYVEAYRTSADVMTSPASGDEIGLPEIAEAVSEIGNDALDFLQGLCVAGAYFEWDMGELSLVHEECDMATVAGGERYCDAHDSAAPCPIGGGE